MSQQPDPTPVPPLLPWLDPAAFLPLSPEEEANLAAWWERYQARLKSIDEYHAGLQRPTEKTPF